MIITAKTIGSIGQYIYNKKTVWKATLNIATSTNGEKILYDVFPIEMVERSSTLDTTTTNFIVDDSSKKINDQNVNISDDEQFSDKNTESVYDLMGEKKRFAEENAVLVKKKG